MNIINHSPLIIPMKIRKHRFVLTFLSALFLLSCGSSGGETRQIPIFMYHDFVEENPAAFRISVGTFEKQLQTISDCGYTAVTFEDVIEFVSSGGDLPEKCVILTSDDGYASVPELAIPLCERYGMTLSCAVIGELTGAPGHFDPSAIPVSPSLELVSHTFRLHKTGVLSRDDGLTLGERLEEDTALMKEALFDAAPMTAKVLVYPGGEYSAESERICRSLGYAVTVTCDYGCACVTRGDADSLYCLPRFPIGEGTSPDEIREILK